MRNKTEYDFSKYPLERLVEMAEDLKEYTVALSNTPGVTVSNPDYLEALDMWVSLRKALVEEQVKENIPKKPSWVIEVKGDK